MRYALYHWRFFERFVGEETQWLAPDNFQEQPAPVVALRTSPTNIGLQLLGITSARDLGLLTVGEMIERLEQVFKALERMRRHRGHFFNWYELEGSERPSAGVHLHGRQRQPRGPFARPQAGVPRDHREAARCARAAPRVEVRAGDHARVICGRRELGTRRRSRKMAGRVEGGRTAEDGAQ